MRHGIKIAAALAAVAFTALAGCAPAPSPEQRNVASLASDAQSGFVIVGTLSTLGSFEWDVAPLRTRLGLIGKEAGADYLRHKITQEQAQAIYAGALGAAALIDEAVKVCRQDERTGRCRGSEARARGLLVEARSAIAAIPYHVH